MIPTKKFNFFPNCGEPVGAQSETEKGGVQFILPCPNCGHKEISWQVQMQSW